MKQIVRTPTHEVLDGLLRLRETRLGENQMEIALFDAVVHLLRRQVDAEACSDEMRRA